MRERRSRPRPPQVDHATKGGRREEGRKAAITKEIGCQARFVKPFLQPRDYSKILLPLFSGGKKRRKDENTSSP